MGAQVPEGWYPDPQATARGAERWWNGHGWTAHTRVVAQPPPPPAAELRPGVGADAEPGGSGVGGGRPDLAQRLRSLPRQLPDGTPVPELAERAGAHVADVLLVWFAASVVSGVLSLGLGISGRFLAPDGLAWFFLDTWLDAGLIAGFWLLYQLAFRGSGGATVGKRMLRLRVRPEPGGPLTTLQVLRRSVLGGGAVLFLMFPGVGILALGLVGFDVYRMAQDPLGRPWHDQVAGTVVVRAPTR